MYQLIIWSSDWRAEVRLPVAQSNRSAELISTACVWGRGRRRQRLAAAALWCKAARLLGPPVHTWFALLRGHSTLPASLRLWTQGCSGILADFPQAAREGRTQRLGRAALPGRVALDQSEVFRTTWRELDFTAGLGAIWLLFWMGEKEFSTGPRGSAGALFPRSAGSLWPN